jgi:monofunctional biosynthetic peptidoglycan transglycosylase
MEVYLNSIEMGGTVFMVLAATEHWYRKDASRLQSKLLELLLYYQILVKRRNEKRTATDNFLVTVWSINTQI